MNEKSESQQTAPQPQRRMAFTKQVNRYSSDHMTAAVTIVRDKETAKIKINIFMNTIVVWKIIGGVEKNVQKYRKILKKEK